MTASKTNRYHNLGFDPDELRDKYRAERDKRVREDGNDQYQNMSDHFAHYLDDPYVGTPIVPPAAGTRHNLADCSLRQGARDLKGP